MGLSVQVCAHAYRVVRVHAVYVNVCLQSSQVTLCVRVYRVHSTRVYVWCESA